MRRRWEALWTAGCFTQIGAQGLRMALWVNLRANWRTCEIKVSVRRVAREIGCGPSSVQRGINELVKVGILHLLSGGGPGRRSVYVVPNCAPVGNSSAPYGGAVVPVLRVQALPPAGTTAPPLGTNCAPVGNKLRPHTEHMTVISVGINKDTNRNNNTDTAGAGVRPARRVRESRLVEGPPRSAAEGDQEAPAFDPSGTITQEVDT
jgi:hypothetical protein